MIIRRKKNEIQTHNLSDTIFLLYKFYVHLNAYVTMYRRLQIFLIRKVYLEKYRILRRTAYPGGIFHNKLQRFMKTTFL